MEDSLQQMPGSNMDGQTNTSDQDFDTSASENSENQNMQVELQIPVAVFTAYRGYDWSKLPDFISYDDAKKLFDKIMSFKSIYYDDFLPIGDAFKGVFYTGGAYAVAFRLMTAEKWDQGKRNAYYCACAFVTIDKFESVDFERLLDMEYFRKPNYKPPATLDCSDDDYFPPSREDCHSTIAKLRDEGKNVRDWKLIGRILSEFGRENRQWLFARVIRKGEEPKDVSKFGEWKPSLRVDHEDDLTKNEMLHGIGIQPNSVVPSAVPNADAGRTDGPLMPTTEMTMGNRNEDECNLNHAAAELVAANEEWERYCACLQTENDNLKKAIQTISLERDSARSVSQNLRIRMENLQIRVGNQNASVNWPLLILAFLLGVIVFLGIQLLAGFSGDDRPHDGASYTEDQSEEYQ